MKCRICGARLASTGDICTDCYNELMEEKKLESDTDILYTVRRKYSIKNVVLRFFVILLSCVLVLLYSLASGAILSVILVILFYAAFLGITLAIDKYLAKNTVINFYKSKVEYKFNSPKFGSHKILDYKKISSITPIKQTWAQKSTGLTDLCLYTNDMVILSYFDGIHIKNVENIEDVMDDLRKLFGMENETKKKRRNKKEDKKEDK